MAIFKITKEKTEAIQSEHKTDFFRNESGLEDFFEKNLEKLLGVRFLYRQFPTSANEGFIDTLGLDVDNSPTIIEYKWDKDDGVLTQGLSYRTWLLENRRVFQTLVENKLSRNEEVNWEQPRLILIAQSFSRRIKNAVRQLGFVELVTYACYEPDILHLDGIEVSSENIVSPIIDESGNAVLYDKNYHISLLNSDITKEKIELLRQRILSLSEVKELLNQKTGITYKSNKKFIRLEFKATYVQILLKNATYPKDNKRIVEDITSHKWGYNGKIRFNNESDIDYIFEIIKEAYNQTL